jgi:ABC-type transport system substrate-binding protein
VRHKGNGLLAVYDTLYGYDAEFNARPQMVEGHAVQNDGLQWDVQRRNGLIFHDGFSVRAPDCVATIKRWAKRYAMGQALMDHTDELAATSDKTIGFHLKKPFPLLPEALAEPFCSIMPERLGKTDSFEHVKGSGRFGTVQIRRFRTHTRPARRVREEPRLRAADQWQTKLQRRSEGGHIERVVWNYLQDPATAAAALAKGEVDWWENPLIDLVHEHRYATARMGERGRATRQPRAAGQGRLEHFYTSLGGMGNVSPGPNLPLRANGSDTWFGWPDDPRMETLREAWFEAPDQQTRQKICRRMREEFWLNPSYVPLGLRYQPTAFRADLKDVREGWPQFYGVRRA